MSREVQGAGPRSHSSLVGELGLEFRLSDSPFKDRVVVLSICLDCSLLVIAQKSKQQNMSPIFQHCLKSFLE